MSCVFPTITWWILLNGSEFSLCGFYSIWEPIRRIKERKVNHKSVSLNTVLLYTLMISNHNENCSDRAQIISSGFVLHWLIWFFFICALLISQLMNFLSVWRRRAPTAFGAPGMPTGPQPVWDASHWCWSASPQLWVHTRFSLSRYRCTIKQKIAAQIWQFESMKK